MTAYYHLEEARKHLPAIVDRVAAGEEIVIAKSGTPLAEMIPYLRKKRRPGIWEGKLQLDPDFDVPLPTELLDAFEGRSS